MTINKRPMGHIAHLRNLGLYKNHFPISNMISFPFAPSDPGGGGGGVGHYINQLTFVDVRKLSSKIQLF
jgi:hypothetical protein